jgi:DNA-binding FadR family transcriptional regulator
LVLESQRVSLDDLMSAMQWLEPVCAASAAARPDRGDAVVPVLRAAIDASVELIEDPVGYAQAARAFHDAIVATCGNETVRLMVGALESLWKAQVQEQRRGGDAGVLPDRALREASVEVHERLVAAIECGDQGHAEAIARAHFSDRDIKRLYAPGELAVRSSLLRDR